VSPVSDLSLMERLIPSHMYRWIELIRNLAVRDVETRYKHSLLGLYWTLINPLVTALIFTFVFGDIFHAPSPDNIPYIVFLLSGLTFWNFFANSVLSATGSITGNAQLLAKLYFPRVVLPVASVLARSIDFAFSFVVLMLFVLMYRVPFHWTYIWLPAVLILQMIFTQGVAYLTAALNVLYRDMTQLVGLVLMVWMYMSPVMYTASSHPGLQSILLLNPMGALIQVERSLMFTGYLSDTSFLWVAILWTLMVYAVGLRVFKRIEPLFAEVL